MPEPLPVLVWLGVLIDDGPNTSSRAIYKYRDLSSQMEEDREEECSVFSLDISISGIRVGRDDEWDGINNKSGVEVEHYWRYLKESGFMPMLVFFYRGGRMTTRPYNRKGIERWMLTLKWIWVFEPLHSIRVSASLFWPIRSFGQRPRPTITYLSLFLSPFMHSSKKRVASNKSPKRNGDRRQERQLQQFLWPEIPPNVSIP